MGQSVNIVVPPIMEGVSAVEQVTPRAQRIVVETIVLPRQVRTMGAVQKSVKALTHSLS